MNSNLVWSQAQLFKDDFNAGSLDETDDWRRGAFTTVTFVNGSLHLTPPIGKAGWIVTQDAFPLDNTTIKIKNSASEQRWQYRYLPFLPKVQKRFRHLFRSELVSILRWA
jgi:hypothetical protein